jgi:hypothetical protein
MAHLTATATCLATFDWRTYRASGLTEEEKAHKALFRGGTGHKHMAIALFAHLEKCDVVGADALEAARRRGYHDRPDHAA